ncbi:MAG: restriction endonuclease [Chloroflexi bacterium]|nr:restriction endonuclease [Chloroflexota bacterium]
MIIRLATPDYQSLMLPVLSALDEREAASLTDIRSEVSGALNLTPSELAELLPSGRQSRFANRVNWAAIYLSNAGLVKRIRRGTYQITVTGKQLLATGPQRVDLNTLQQYPQFVDWWTGGQGKVGTVEPIGPIDSIETPEETLSRAAEQLRLELEGAVLDRVRDSTPAFFEQIVVDLLIAMGYGGGDSDMGRVTGRSGDGGIDGTIREDALGLDEVYVQVKKYAAGNSVGEGELRNFAGAIDAAGTTKGVFVTTSAFTKAASAYVARSPKRIALIDGKQLARLMVVFDVGVRTRTRHEIKRIDEDYFESAAD